MTLGFTCWASVLSFAFRLNRITVQSYHWRRCVLCSCTLCFAYALLLSFCHTVLPDDFGCCFCFSSALCFVLLSLCLWCCCFLSGLWIMDGQGRRRNEVHTYEVVSEAKKLSASEQGYRRTNCSLRWRVRSKAIDERIVRSDDASGLHMMRGFDTRTHTHTHLFRCTHALSGSHTGTSTHTHTHID